MYAILTPWLLCIQNAYTLTRLLFRLTQVQSRFQNDKIRSPFDQCFDVGTSIVLRNDALRSGKTCWCCFRRRCVPLADIWSPIFQSNVPASLNEVALGIIKLDKLASKQVPLYMSTISDFVTCAPWRSSPIDTLALNESLNPAAVFDRA